MDKSNEEAKIIRAYDPINKRWYTWSWIVPDNLLDLIKEEGFILEKDINIKNKKDEKIL